MPEIFFAGDTHGNFDHVIAAVQAYRPHAVVFLGDLQAPQPLEQVLAPILPLTDIWFIHGNHDTDTDADYDHLFGSALADRNLHGRVASVAGVRIAGLGGVFREPIWKPPAAGIYRTHEDCVAGMMPQDCWRGGLARKHRSSIFPAEVEQLQHQHADILVTHEAPSCHPNGNAAIDELARRLGVGRAFHGHHHDRRDYRVCRARLGFTAHGVGLCEIVSQGGRVVYSGLHQ